MSSTKETIKEYANDTDNMHSSHRRPSIEELRSIIAPIAERYGVDKVYLFGSVARGDDDEKSDYDFFIEKGKIRSAFVLTGFRLDIQDAIGCKIDLVSTNSIRPEFLNNIMNERVPIYG